MSIYEHDTVVITTEYLGCWRDSKSDRIMDVVESDASMTNDVSIFPPVLLDAQVFRARGEQV